MPTLSSPAGDVMATRRRLLSEHLVEPLGSRLARLRRERGLSQKDLAALLDVSQPIVSDYETGRLRLHGDVIVALAKILKVSTDELLGVTTQPRQVVIKDRRLLERLAQIDQLPKRKKDALLVTIKAFLSAE